MDYASSSHLQKWIVSEQKLMELRAEANKKGVEYVLKLRRDHGEPVDDLHPLQPAEEQILYSYYAQAIADKGKRVWDAKVTATAVTFVKRFFLNHSCMEYEVMKIVFTCLYIAGKVSERYIDADTIARMFNNVMKAEEILSLETVVLAGLEFDLVVYQPYHYVAAMVEELRVAAESENADINMMVEQHPGQPVIELVGKLAQSFTHSIVQSDAVLLMSPQQQALCAVCHSLVKHGMPHETVVRRYAKLACTDESKQHQMVSSIKEVIEKGNLMAAAGHQRSDKEIVTKLDKQNRRFNPLMDTTSTLYKTLKKKSKKKKRRRDDGA